MVKLNKKTRSIRHFFHLVEFQNQCQIVYSYFSYLLFLFFLLVLWVPLTCIYIPKSNVYYQWFLITKIRDSPFSLFSHGIRVQGEKKPNYFRFICESILGNLSVTVFHSNHLPHLLKLSGQPYRRQKTLTAGNFFQRLFRQSPFPTPTIPSGAQGGDLQVLSKHRKENLSRGRISVTRQPRAFLLRRPEPQSSARGAHSGNALPPLASPDAVQPPSICHVPSEPCKCIFLGFLSPPAL